MVGLHQLQRVQCVGGGGGACIACCKYSKQKTENENEYVCL